MFGNKAAKVILFALIVVPVLFISAYAPLPSAQTAPIVAAVTATTAPVSPTAAPTTAPAAAAASADQLTAWCMPEGYFPNLAGADPTVMPTIARTGTVVNGTLSFQVPFSSCTFVYTFAQAKPAGAILQVYDMTPAPWLKVPLKVSASNPNVMYAVLRHSYIINPPLWTTTYRFVVVGADGTKIKEDPLTFHKYAPALCWNGLLPNPTTLTCRKQQDIHPWDASYPKKYYHCYDFTCVK